MAYDNGSAELELFKATDINTVLPALGWTRHPKELKTYHKGDRSIKVYQSKYGAAWRFSEFAGGPQAIAGGTVIDLVLAENGNNFAAMRTTLRAAINSPTLTPSSNSSATANSSFSLAKKDTPAPTYDSEKAVAEYLKNSSPARGIPDYFARRNITEIRASNLKMMRISAAGGIRFPYGAHVDGVFKVVGYEEKWFNSDGESCRRYMTGGAAGVWIAGIEDHDGTVVIAESPVDALAYEQINGGKSMLVAIRSGTAKVAAEVVNNAILAGEVSRVTIATDNDAAGMSYAAELMSLIMSDFAQIRYVSPPGAAKDWTEVLTPDADRDVAQNTPF